MPTYTIPDGADPMSVLLNNAQPGRPAYIPGYNPGTMSLWEQMMGDVSGLQTDQRGIGKFREEALRTGPSTWSRLANEQQGSLATQARDKASATAAGQRATAESNLAMRGGLDSGARQSLAKSSMRNALDMNQQIGQTQANNAAQIAMNDEQNRISQLGSLPGLENTANQSALDMAKLKGQANQFDIAALINENNQKNNFNKDVYNSQMSAWGAARQADATENSGKK